MLFILGHLGVSATKRVFYFSLIWLGPLGHKLQRFQYVSYVKSPAGTKSSTTHWALLVFYKSITFAQARKNYQLTTFPQLDLFISTTITPGTHNSTQDIFAIGNVIIKGRVQPPCCRACVPLRLNETVKLQADCGHILLEWRGQYT